MPDTLFKPLVARLDRLIDYHRRKWPDGVDPSKMADPLVRQLGPMRRAYQAGVRSSNLYEQMQRLRELLEISWLPDEKEGGSQ
jgi:hypothetical protein